MICTKIELRVLSEEQIPSSYDLETVIKRGDDDYVVEVISWHGTRVTKPEMARYLIEAGSDPQFFDISPEEGNYVVREVPQ